MIWNDDLYITYKYAKKIAKEKFDMALSSSDFEDMIKDFKKKQVINFTNKEIEILVQNYYLNAVKE